MNVFFSIKTKFELNQRLSLTVYEVSAHNFEVLARNFEISPNKHAIKKLTVVNGKLRPPFWFFAGRIKYA